MVIWTREQLELVVTLKFGYQGQSRIDAMEPAFILTLPEDMKVPEITVQPDVSF